jgi:hypothetical protein
VSEILVWRRNAENCPNLPRVLRNKSRTISIAFCFFLGELSIVQKFGGAETLGLIGQTIILFTPIQFSKGQTELPESPQLLSYHFVTF